jgi:hypothetical protein
MKPPKKTSKNIKLTKKKLSDAELLSKIAEESSAQAVREAKALGLTVTYLENGVIYRESADGKREKVMTIEKKKKLPFNIKPGQKIRVRK